MKKTKLIGIIMLFVILVLASSAYFLRRGIPVKINLASSSQSFPIVEEKKSEIRMLFLGDVMLDRYIRQVMEKRGEAFIWGEGSEFLKENDAVVINLEGPITSQASKSVNTKMGEKNNYVFTFDQSVTKILREHNIQVANLGNNHILNFGEDGLNETKKLLEEAGIDYFGAPGDDKVLIRDIRGVKVGLVAYNQFEKGSNDSVLRNLVGTRSQTDFLVVYTHWGKEFAVEPEEDLRQLAHSWIDAGADLIIGSHPHVVMSQEEYKGKRIYYSLGNFIFDQYFDEKTKKGLAVQVVMDGKTKRLQFQERDVVMSSNGRTSLP